MKLSELIRLASDSKFFSEWLETIKSQDVLKASTAVFELTSELKKQCDEIETQDLYRISCGLTPKLLELTLALERIYLKNTDHYKIIQLSMAMLRQLAFFYLQCVDRLEDKHKLNSLSHALQLQGMVCYQSVLSYHPPTASLWREMGVAYQKAVQSNLRANLFEPVYAAWKPLNTIDKIIKRNLLFAISNPYVLNEADIKQLFGLCSECQEYVQLHKLGMNSNEGFCWDYTTEQLPYPVSGIQAEKNQLLFNVDALINAHKQGKVQLPIRDAERVINNISLYKHLFNSAPTVLPNHHVFVGGAEQVFTFFHKHIREGLAWNLNSPTPDKLNFSSLEIYQESEVVTNKLEKIGRDDIWGNAKQDKQKLAFNQFGALKTFRTAEPGFFVFESLKVELKPQDLLVLYGNDLKPYLAIVRCLKPSPVKHLQKGLIEILRGKVTPIEWHEAKTKELAILLSRDKQHYLYIKPKKINLLSVLKAIPYEMQLKRCQEVTPHFMCFRVNVMPGAVSFADFENS